MVAGHAGASGRQVGQKTKAGSAAQRGSQARKAVAHLFWVLLWLAGSAGAATAQGAREYQIKAAYLYNFAKFVDWPADAFASRSDPVKFCVLGDNPFDGELAQAIAGQEIGGRPLQATFLRNAHSARGCHILFISTSERKRITDILADLQGANVLTVDDTSGSLQQGVVINFIMDGQHVAFEVNLAAARQAGLVISSRMLSIAKVIVGKSGGQE
jgi:hypothetical protein